MTNDSKANLNQLFLYGNNYQTMIKQLSDLDKTNIDTWICSNPKKQPLNQSDDWPKVNLNQSPFCRSKINLCVAFKPSLILGARFLMYNASRNSNWDQLLQVSRTQKLELTALAKCGLLLTSVVEGAISGNLCKPIICASVHSADT